MRGEIEIGPVEARLVPVGATDPDPRVVGHQLPRYPAHEGERTDMRTDPFRQALGQRRFGVGVIGRPQYRDEDLRRPDLAAGGVDQLKRLAGIIDKQAFTGGMNLSHRWRQPALPGAIQLAPAAVVITVRLAL